MSDLFKNHIVCFPARRLICLGHTQVSVSCFEVIIGVCQYGGKVYDSESRGPGFDVNGV